MKKVLLALLLVFSFNYSLSADRAIIINEEIYLNQIDMIVDGQFFPETASFFKNELKVIVFNDQKLNNLTLDMCKLSANMYSLMERDSIRPYSLNKYKYELREIYKSFFYNLFMTYKFDVETVDGFFAALDEDTTMIDTLIKNKK